MIVADASAVALALLTDGSARSALANEDIAVPHLVDAEVASALRGQWSRAAISERQASAALAVWSRMGVRRYQTSGLWERVWELRENLSAYDASYVALAEAFDTTLVTAGKRLAAAPGPRCPITVLRD